ncbi:hypothetical protein N7467_003036 [Penicillium canescens]|nr:hypothetical protein N7467_003036 [Penicillium canescens]
MVKVRIANWSDAHQEKSILAAELAGADVVEAADDTEALDSDWLLIEDCVAEKGLDTSVGCFAFNGDWVALEEDLEPSSMLTWSPLNDDFMENKDNESGTYFGESPESSPVERYVWIAPETLRKIEVLYDGAYMGPVHYLDDEELPRRRDRHHS